jgi:hypothetical protein
MDKLVGRPRHKYEKMIKLPLKNYDLRIQAELKCLGIGLTSVIKDL